MADPKSTTSASMVQCGGCGTSNDGDSSYCSGCGQSLFEPCYECSKPVRLSQSFCGNCGANLKQAIEKKFSKYESFIADAVRYAKDDRFEQSIELLSRVSAVDDFRFQELKDQASQAIKKIGTLETHRRQAAVVAQGLAEKAIEAEDHRAVVEALRNAPLNLVSDEVREGLERAQAYLSSHQHVEDELRKALAENRVADAGAFLDQLCELERDKEALKPLTRKVSRILMAKARGYFEARKYTRAAKCLEAIPAISRNEESLELQRLIDDIRWYRAQLDYATFNSPALGRLAVRLTQVEPHEPLNKKRVEEISKSLKGGERVGRSHLPLRKHSAECWIGGPQEPLSRLSRFRRAELPQLNGAWHRMNVAIGLGLQGLGKARVECNMIPKKGLFSVIGRKRASKRAWGLDIGSFAVKAVLLETNEKADEVSIADGFLHEYEVPLCRPGGELDYESLSACLATLTEKHSFGDTPVWINLPAPDLISRFVLLPPVAKKQVKELIERETKSRIPFELDELWIDSWVAPLEQDDSALGRPSVIHAVKKKTIDERLNHLESLNLQLEGMQADSLSLANLLAFEFEADLLQAKSIEDDEDDWEEKTPTVVAVDCGAESTSIVFVSKNAHWVWTLEMGGEGLTALLARETKKTRGEAEIIKRSLQKLENPALRYSSCEDKMVDWREKLRRVVGEAKNANSHFDVVSVEACGGSCLTHQWFERVLAAGGWNVS
ncbi:MAG: pilus assembly protein PilM [Planctomycetota bacterium]